MHLPCIRISTISKLTEPSFHLSLFTQEYQIVRPKWFPRLWCIRRKLCTYLALKLTISKTNRSKIPYETRHLGVPLGASKFFSKHMVCSLQIMHLSCIKISTISKTDQTELPLEPLHWSTDKCFQNGFLDYGALGANHEHILHPN